MNEDGMMDGIFQTEVYGRGKVNAIIRDTIVRLTKDHDYGDKDSGEVLEEAVQTWRGKEHQWEII